ncbi:putative histidine kinase HHK12p [Trematosphaeria pertusa]|uniref:Putative histidine kinase HHK12p n=1 Tax=Trematosphaeria pertusa TaxID=390896 RepID=A0A6A6IWT8_9PLEO|nr:putative histidine kinase HHK12p [Trematosphaeria pertusa]KAF2253673.1 putative histidine kinase HHK12p [Trematosphaeria pertusa]
MENLDKLTAAGLPIFDLDQESLERKDWSESPLGPRDSWPTALTVLVNSCILPIPHCAAIFWGADLSIVHNLAWGKARGDLDGLGASADDSYSHEALGALRGALRGRTVKVASRFFLKHTPDQTEDAQLLLSTILDERGKRQGVLAQLLENVAAERYVPLSLLEELSEKHPARRTKDSAAQQPDSYPGKEQADSKQTQLFQRFAELLPNGLAILDKEAEAVFVNDGFFKLTTNKGKNEFRAWPESIHPQDYERVMSAYREAFSRREELRIEFRCATEIKTTAQDGEWRLFLFRPLSEDPEAGFICAVVDITEIKQAEITQEKAAVEAQERKEQQERFIDMVSHEIRNPLSAVLHLAEEVKEVAKEIDASHADVSEQVADIMDAADTILLCVSHQNTLVDDILSFSKLDSMMLSLVPREVRPKWEFSKALKVFHSEFKAKGIQFHYAMDVSYEAIGVDHVIADLNRMKQVLVNLITNAIKFTARKDGERKITVSMGASIKRPTSYPPNVIFFDQETEAFHIDSTMTADWGNGSIFYLMVAVRDTGIGISPEGQAKLFERFRQATPKTQERYGGSGLGLFISRKLCQLHGGDIGVSSKDGEGSTFGFFFKVRRSDGSNEGGRPPFGSRSVSETSNPPREQTPRPSFSRANSNLHDIKERSIEHRPKPVTLTSHDGVDIDDVASCLKDPPTERRLEIGSQSKLDDRYRETQAVSDQIQQTHSPLVEAIDKQMPQLKAGETERQEEAADDLSKSQSKERSDVRDTLLLVEDNLINQKVLRRQLQAKGFEVFIANNGQEAIDAVAERGKLAPDKAGDRNYFDCILMDQEMPIKDGNAATIEIRELQARGEAGRSPILGVSANVREAQTKSMLEAGMDAIISKPYKVDDLVKKIQSLLPRNDNG